MGPPLDIERLAGRAAPTPSPAGPCGGDLSIDGERLTVEIRGRRRRLTPTE
jgi:hypothetical protein